MKKKCHYFSTDRETVVKRVVFIDGLTRAGKLFLGKILSTLKNMENFQAINTIQQIPYIQRLGGMSEDAAIALIRALVDESAYNLAVGRYLNMRYSDASSICHSVEFDEYMRRSLTLDREKLLNSYYEDRTSLFVLHETLSNVDVLFKAYPDLMMINLLRHPIDVIHSWYLRGWGHRYGSDPTSLKPSLKGINQPVPWFAYEWKEEYETISEIDRIIKSIAVLTEMGKEAHNHLTEEYKRQILFVRYENVVERTHDTVKSICSFLKMDPSDKMPQILARERCPKEISLQNREKKSEKILGLASKDV